MGSFVSYPMRTKYVETEAELGVPPPHFSTGVTLLHHTMLAQTPSWSLPPLPTPFQ